MSLRWGKFAEIAVRKMAQAKPGEKLLVLTDTWADQEVAQACLAAGLTAGAQATLLVMPRMAPSDTSDLDPVTAAAIAEADVVLGVCETMFTAKDSTERALENGTRIAGTDIKGMEDFAIEGLVSVDYEHMIDVANRIGALWQQTELCRVTSPYGTDITYDMRGRPLDVGTGIAAQPGDCDYFPGVSVANAPIEKTIHGTIVVDGNIPPGRLVKEPVTLHMVDGVIAEIEGSADAAALRAHFDESGDPIAKHLCHFTLGLNPRARTSGSVHQDEHVLGAVTYGFGQQAAGFGGCVPPCNVHCDVVLTTARIECDGEVMLDDNQLNEEMGFGGIA